MSDLKQRRLQTAKKMLATASASLESINSAIESSKEHDFNGQIATFANLGIEAVARSIGLESRLQTVSFETIELIPDSARAITQNMIQDIGQRLHMASESIEQELNPTA